VAHGYPIFNFLIFTIFILCNNEVSMDFFGAITNILNLFWMWVFENRFLGYFQPQEGKPALWELDSDYYLHVGGNGDEACTDSQL
jgi:hypothetical protein